MELCQLKMADARKQSSRLFKNSISVSKKAESVEGSIAVTSAGLAILPFSVSDFRRESPRQIKPTTTGR